MASSSTGQRPDAITWEQFYMGVAVIAAKRSNHSEYKNGACVVNEHGNVVGIGYTRVKEIQGTSDTYEIHAATDAIIRKSAPHVNGCRIYLKRYPCNECTKIILQAGICKVVYMTEGTAGDDSFEASKKMFETANFKYAKQADEPVYKQLTITQKKKKIKNMVAESVWIGCQR